MKVRKYTILQPQKGRGKEVKHQKRWVVFCRMAKSWTCTGSRLQSALYDVQGFGQAFLLVPWNCFEACTGFITSIGNVDHGSGAASTICGTALANRLAVSLPSMIARSSAQQDVVQDWKRKMASRNLGKGAHASPNIRRKSCCFCAFHSPHVRKSALVNPQTPNPNL